MSVLVDQNFLNSDPSVECCVRSRYQGQRQVIISHTEYLWDVITCPCPWYLILAQHALVENNVTSSMVNYRPRRAISGAWDMASNSLMLPFLWLADLNIEWGLLLNVQWFLGNLQCIVATCDQQELLPNYLSWGLSMHGKERVWRPSQY